MTMNLSYTNNPSAHTFLNSYYIYPTYNNSRVNHEVNKINTVTKPDKKYETQCSNTNHIYQNIQKD